VLDVGSRGRKRTADIEGISAGRAKGRVEATAEIENASFFGDREAEEADATMDKREVRAAFDSPNSATRSLLKSASCIEICSSREEIVASLDRRVSVMLASSSFCSWGVEVS
jgi:hypothetical protein